MIDSTYFRVAGKSMFLRNVLTGTSPTPCPLHRPPDWRQHCTLPRERKRMRTHVSNARRRVEIPRACLQICPRIEKLVDMELLILFRAPFVSCFFGYLHEAALLHDSHTSLGSNRLSRQRPLSPASDPGDVQVHRANERIVLLKPRRAHPFVKRVKTDPRIRVRDRQSPQRAPSITHRTS